MKNLLSSNPSSRFSIKGKFLCVFLGLFLALVSLELFLRLLGFGYNLIHKAPVDTGADYRIYCVGESTTWGIGASDPIAKGYPRQLEEMLKKHYKGIKIQCFFDQTIGQNTSEVLAKLPQHIEKYRPQLLILMVGVNNWWNMDWSNILLFSNNEVVSRFTLKVLIFLDQFRVWKLFKSIAFRAGFFRERWDYWLPQEIIPGVLNQEFRKVMDFQIFDRLAEHDIEEMIKISRSQGIPVILCTYPMISMVTEIHRNLARKFQIPLVDHFSVFNKLKDQQSYLSTDDHWHPNDRGYAIVARNLYDCIVKNGFIQERKAGPR